jgi:calcineurin-like phosphoesterase family protein
MDDTILVSYQRALSPDDDLWIIGDFAVCHSRNAQRLEYMLASIPGRKRLVRGNHDKPWITKLSGWESVHELVEINDDGTRVVLCHYPMITFPGARHGGFNLFGHVHNNWQGSRNSVNVGVDVWDFRPVALEDIKKRAKTLPVNPVWDLVEPCSEL